MRKFVLISATGGYIGYMPIAPGTFGSIWGVILYWLVAFLRIPAILLFIAAFSVAAVWVSHQAAAILGENDPKQIVVDEMAGMMVALFALPVLPSIWMAAFLLFRFFDILKPYPISYLEKRCPGGWGIVIDDIFAGIAANLLLRMVLLLFG